MAEPTAGALPSVAFVGLGNMGFPMVSRLVSAGYDVHGFDVSPDAVERLEGIGASGAASAAAAAADAGVIILMLPNSAIVQSVVDDLLAADAVAGSVIVDMSSSEPLATRALAARLADFDIALVDAPVSGGVTGAVNGTLTIMVGGDDAAVEQVLPIVSELGKPVRTGSVGSGHAIKALNNLLSATHLWATSEAMETGVAFGLDPEVMLAVFNTSSGRSGSTQNKWPNFVLPGSYDSGFGLALMLKDMKIALGLADSTHAPHALSSRAVELWSTAAAELPPGADHTEVARWVAAMGSGERAGYAAPRPWGGADADA
ncbi:NAD(P)-dependent oxidoreductase [Naasia lichenicola]|uniref:NAD(P)-dependent oxidoreductase n=1 Tax=Naasia lichenicola TaxID=2565933 RepID=A0A4S4FM30_9MICO|nr:NAD(P)-dependent oxidoreductase [Naasia lichenicola]THG31530.1 NAD(P)-dependent oxidoreductase [Naasia lichenicola]